MQTIEQQIALKALKISEKCNEDQARYYKRMPALIVSCGLIQTLAFIQTKKDVKINGKQLVDNLLQNMQKPVDNFSKLLADADTLRSATTEIMSLLQWINRFNDAKPKSDKTDNKKD